MTMIGQVKNWAEFQHYKDRSPPWIKLHRGLLDDFNFTSLPLASKALAPLVWLLAAESCDGSVSLDPAWLAWRLRIDQSDVEAGLSPLIERGFLTAASKTLAKRKQVAIPETEAEREERERSAASAVDLLAGISPQIVKDFTALRQKVRAPITKTAVDGINREAAKAGLTLEAALTMCCERGWRGFKAEWVGDATKAALPGGGRRAL
jgi:hypothetical protein